MIGEIRDYESADRDPGRDRAPVLATVHQRRRHGADDRLGGEPFLLASSLIGVLAQRLVRKL